MTPEVHRECLKSTQDESKKEKCTGLTHTEPNY